MFDFSEKIDEFHKNYVRLSLAQQSDMKRRREANLSRLRSGLETLGKPKIVEVINQGGYAMKTMVQPPKGDVDSRYDIDMGVVFEGGEALTPVTTKNWVSDALACKASNMLASPENKPKCVRVVYSDGYQCDFPVFRRIISGGSYNYELAVNDQWIESDPAAMNRWFNEKVRELSPECSSSYQLRRVVRLLKYFAKVHGFRRGEKFPAGLVATALVVEEYVPVEGRDDESIYRTLLNLSERPVDRPVMANNLQISDDKDIPRIQRFVHEANIAVAALSAVENSVDAVAVESAWHDVFQHSYFDFCDKSLETKSAGSGKFEFPASVVAAGISDDDRIEQLRKAVVESKSNGGGTKPWGH